MAKKKAPNKEAEKAANKGGLTINEDKQPTSSRVRPGKRLWLNKAKDNLVPDGHKDAASLYCTEHNEVSRAEYEALTK